MMHFFRGRGGVGVVRDHDDRLVELFVQAIQQFQNFMGTGGIEIAGGFVSQDQVRVGDQSASQRNALFLTAGKLAGEMMDALAKPDEIQGSHRVVLALGSV